MSLRNQIRRYAREMIAAVVLVALGLATAGVILSEQNAIWPWEERYEVTAEFSNAQAVTPGQGQTVVVSGVKVGDISDVTLEDGRAVVTMQIEERYAPIYNDARMLLRPRTALKDMQVQLDPGTPESGEVPDGGRLPLAQTLPDVNPDEVLASLDSDTRNWLRLAVEGLGDGIGENGKALRRLLVAGQPTAEQARGIAEAMAGRRREIARLVHNLGVVAAEAGRSEKEISRTVSWAGVVLGALADQDDALRASLDRLPGTLDAAGSALRNLRPLSAELEPAARALIPAVRRLTPALDELRPLVRETTPVVRHRLRPLVRTGIPVLRELNPAAADLGGTMAELPAVVEDANYIVNELLHNPEGPEEGYGFWTAWFFHNAASMLSTEDAHGSGWRGLVTFSCSSLQNLQTFIPQSGIPLQIPDPALLPGC